MRDNKIKTLREWLKILNTKLSDDIMQVMDDDMDEEEARNIIDTMTSFETIFDEAEQKIANMPTIKEALNQDKSPENDADLTFLVFDKIEEEVLNNENTYESVFELSPAKGVVYIVCAFESEIKNGGFNQYYYNQSGQFAHLTPDMLELIGAGEFADLARHANAVYEKYHAQITEKQDGTLEGFSASCKDNPLEIFDDEFFVLDKQKSLYSMTADFIRANKKEFANL